MVLLGLSGSPVTEVVEAFRGGHHVVRTTHDTEDTEREDPGSDNSDDVSPVLREPAEQGETGGDDIDDEHGTSQLPRGDRRPEGTLSSGDENQPVFSQRDLQEQDTVQRTEVLDDTTLGHEHGSKGNPGTDGQDDTENDRHTP